MSRVLVVALPGTESARAPDGATDIVVVVPALASTVEALTGAVDDRRADAEETQTGWPHSCRTRAARSVRTIRHSPSRTHFGRSRRTRSSSSGMTRSSRRFATA